MEKNHLTLKQQIGVCQHVCRLVHAKLPIPGELKLLASGTSGPVADATHRVNEQLESGHSLAASLAGSDAPNSRSLAACIQAGELTNGLGESLRAWTDVHIENSKAKKAFWAAMLYPATLVVLATVVLCFLIWNLLPEYESTYVLFETQIPFWLQWLGRVRENTPLAASLILVAILAPLITLIFRGRGVLKNGLPKAQDARERQQALACDMTAQLLENNTPLQDTCQIGARASGASNPDCDDAFQKIRKQETATSLGREASAILSSVYITAMPTSDATESLRELASHLRESAQLHSARRARWLPMLVALSVGGVTFVTYAALIYAPWVFLLQEIASPENLNMQF